MVRYGWYKAPQVWPDGVPTQPPRLLLLGPLSWGPVVAASGWLGIPWVLTHPFPEEKGTMATPGKTQLSQAASLDSATATYPPARSYRPLRLVWGFLY